MSTISKGNVTANYFIGNGSQITGMITPHVALNTSTAVTVEDTGKHYYKSANGDLTLTVASNATQPFQIGAKVELVNLATGNITVAQDSGVTLYRAGNSSAGNKVVTSYGHATLFKVATDTWIIDGTGVV
jgi:hypothetical protein